MGHLENSTSSRCGSERRMPPSYHPHRSADREEEVRAGLDPHDASVAESRDKYEFAGSGYWEGDDRT